MIGKFFECAFGKVFYFHQQRLFKFRATIAKRNSSGSSISAGGAQTRYPCSRTTVDCTNGASGIFRRPSVSDIEPDRLFGRG